MFDAADISGRAFFDFVVPWSAGEEDFAALLSGALISILLALTLVSRKTGTHWDISVPVTLNGVLANVLMLQDVRHEGEINHAFWSVAVESKIYVLFPFLVFLKKRFGLAASAVSFVAGGLVLTVILRPTPLVGLTPWYLCLFTYGVVGAEIASSRASRGGGAFLLSALLTAGVVGFFCGSWTHEAAAQRFVFLDQLVGISTACFLIYAWESNSANRVLSFRPLVFIGTFAYSIYLIHAPLLQLATQTFVFPFHLTGSAAFAATLAAIPLIIAAAYLFHVVCERPFMSPSLRRATVAEQAGDA